MKALKLISFVVVLLLVSCIGSQTDSNQVVPEVNTVANVGIAFGQTASTNFYLGTDYVNSIRFDKMVEGRCTREQCTGCTGGFIKATFIAQVNNSSKSDTIFLQRASCIDPSDLSTKDAHMDIKTIAGFKVGLVNITELNIKTTDYSAKLILFK